MLFRIELRAFLLYNDATTHEDFHELEEDVTCGSKISEWVIIKMVTGFPWRWRLKVVIK